MWNPPDPKGYNQIVWEIVRQIPEGHVMSYGQIAAMIPPPQGVTPPSYQQLGPRWVGQAMRATPSGEGIPWQRVINSQGAISFPPGSANANQQRALLEAEGVAFTEKGRVDFNQFGWDGPDSAWLEQHDLFPPPSLGRGTSQRRGTTNQPKLF